MKEEKVIYRDAPASKIPAQPTTNHPLSCVVYSVSFQLKSSISTSDRFLSVLCNLLIPFLSYNFLVSKKDHMKERDPPSHLQLVYVYGQEREWQVAIDSIKACVISGDQRNILFILNNIIDLFTLWQYCLKELIR